jgi:LPS-assembly protein
MRHISGIPIVLCLALCGAARAEAQELAGCQTHTSKQWTMERLGTDHWKLVGQVEVTCTDETFFADEIELWNDQGRLVATGNVVFTTGTSRIAAERLDFNTRTKTGVFYNASGSATIAESPTHPQAQDRVRSAGPHGQERFSPTEPEGPGRAVFGAQEPDVYFYGETLHKLGEQKYKITRGGFTTCLQPTPRWELTSSSVTLNLEHYAILTNSLFKVKGVPVFYMPIFYYPVQKDDRATGFLIPTYGGSTIRGQSLSNAFFWAISRSQDLTLLHDWYSKTGQGYGTEYRYVRGAGSDGVMRFYSLREHEAQYDDTVTPARLSFEIRGSGTQRITPAVRARFRADYFSDIEVQQTYHQNVYDASRRQRVFSGSVTGGWREYNATGTVDRTEYFYGTTSSSIRGGAPRLLINRNERPLFGTFAYLSVNTEYNRMLVERKSDTTLVDQSLTRFDLLPRIRVPFTKWQFLTANSTVAFRTTHWTESRDVTGQQIDQGVSRNYYELQSQVTGPVLNRIWTFPGSRYAEKLKHSIQPYFNVQRTSGIDNFDRIVQIDGADTVVGNTTRLSYGVTNRFYRKPAGGGQSREIVNATVGQSYYTDERAAAYDRYYQTSFNGTAPTKFSPLAIAVRALPTDYITANYRAEYDTQFHAFRTMAADGTLNWHHWLQASGGWSQRRFIQGLTGFNDPTRLDHYLNGLTNVRLKENRYGAMHQFNYDLLRGSFLQQRMMAYYNAQCCGFTVEYQKYDLSRLGYSPVTRDNRLSVSFTLAGVGSFGNFFGAMGGPSGTGGY